jgi:adenylyl-sulfate kinase
MRFIINNFWLFSIISFSRFFQGFPYILAYIMYVLIHKKENFMNTETNLFPQNTDITRSFREKQLHQKACTIWFTGLSGSGKSTLANALEIEFARQGLHTMLLDGDNIRMGLNQNLGFSEEDRVENIRRIAEVAKLMNDAGLIVLTAFISPFVHDRRRAREIIGTPFIEVYVNTPLEECERRDVKGLYAAAHEGKIPQFTGISSPYETPEHPEIIIDTLTGSIEQCTTQLLQQLKGFL